jgi:hypothetical protein
VSRAPLEVFGLSFLDVICCGLGAVLALLVILASQLTIVDDVLSAPTDSTSLHDSFFAFSATCQAPNQFLTMRAVGPMADFRTASRFDVAASGATGAVTAFRDASNANFPSFRLEIVADRRAQARTDLYDAISRFVGDRSVGHEQHIGQMNHAHALLTSAKNEAAWQAAVEAAKDATKGCILGVKEPVQEALRGGGSAWIESRSVAPTVDCEVELVTSRELKRVSQSVVGRREICVVPRGPFYALDLDC